MSSSIPVSHRPPAQGLYAPEFEHDACGVGFVAHVRGHASHGLIRIGLDALKRMDHRGATGAEANTGDGAGILVGLPHDFLARRCAPLGLTLPPRGHYAVGVMFASPRSQSRDQGRALFERVVREEGLELLGWRQPIVNPSGLGSSARAVEPTVLHVFIGRGSELAGDDSLEAEEAFERRLFVVRKRFETLIAATPQPNSEGGDDRSFFYLCSLSCRTMVYKGMLTPEQLASYYADDLEDPSFASALCVFHSRFSTNTFPSWELAHPYRVIAHNGEINTLRGNINWMRAREALFDSPLYRPGDMAKLRPVIREGLSDTACLDNAVELLTRSGYSLPHAMMMLIPEAWQNHATMSQTKKDFYHFHSSLMEPWDGPAAVVFTDGRVVGATLDRNGLRPGRYVVTRDDLVVLASEAGVVEFAPERIAAKGRLEPGRMFLIDLVAGRIVQDDELKERIATARPYGEWLRVHQVKLADLPPAPFVEPPDHATLTRRQIAFGYTRDDFKYVLEPMGVEGQEAVGSMGNDTPPAVLSDRPQPLFNYFKQLFAQVTNPPLDAIREELVTSVDTGIGAERNLLDPVPEACHQIAVDNPILDNDEMAALKQLDGWRGFRSHVLPALFKVRDRHDPAFQPEDLERVLEGLFREAELAVNALGANLLVLSDRGVNEEYAPIPSLLATAGLHHFLVNRGLRSKVGLLVETGEAREVHHFALLLGYGAGAINPYVAFETLDDLINEGHLKGFTHDQAVTRYRQAVKKGVVKVMSKMGISTLHSYRGAQIFEAIGLEKRFIDRYFTKTSSRIGGVGLAEIARDVIHNHRRAFARIEMSPPPLDEGGQYQWRRDGEYHLFNPETVFRLQHATRTRKFELFRDYTRRVDEDAQRLCSLRGLFEIRYDKATPIPLEEVEPVSAIVKRFATGAMSLGAISPEAHETLAIAMNRLGAMSNTGEGGEDPERYRVEPNGDSRRSAIKQVASGRFGVTSEYLVNADEIQIKMAQGAKPGEGGQLPGRKVYPHIAKVRHSTPFVGLISPPPHHDIYSIEDLAQLIHDLKNANDQARISVKLVAEVGVGTVAAGVAKAKADVILISGHDGGTGASPLTSIKHAGIPWELGLAETQQTLMLNKLRDRVVLQTDGQLKTGRDVVIAALLGAEEYGFSTAPLIVMGCVMMRVCHLDTCPVGIASQNPDLRAKFQGKAEHVVAFFEFVAQEVRESMARLGFRTMDEMIGRADLLDTKRAIAHHKARGLDFSAIFHTIDNGHPRRRVKAQDHGLEESLDRREILPRVAEVLEGRADRVELDLAVANVHRTVGTLTGAEITRRFGGAGLPEDSIVLHLNGSAGQSLGAFLPRGLTIKLTGEANDYVGKGLSGGRIVVKPPVGPNIVFVPEENVVIGNVALYGATGGQLFARGRAGERFAVRNSGAQAVVEGVGDHGCEYMTGGVVVVLGPTGRNFAAGMSGGMAFVLDRDGTFAARCNLEMVDLDPFDDPNDHELVRRLIARHLEETGSTPAAAVLADWPLARRQFVKVMPKDLKRALEDKRRLAAEELAA